MNSPYGPAPRRGYEQSHRRPRDAATEEVVLWDIDDVCRFLKVPKQTVYKWNSLGSGPIYTKVGKSLRWKKSDVLAWYEQLPKSFDREA